MERDEVLDWLRRHPAEVHAPPEALLTRCEAEVHDHATREAWLHARDVAEQREQYWRADGGGAHASESFVAREVCRELAAELRKLEPVPQESAVGSYVDGDVLGRLEPDARAFLLHYVLELAQREEHRAWLEIVHFTRERGHELEQDRGFSSERDFEHTHGYAGTAARVMHLLAEEYAQHARPRAD